MGILPPIVAACFDVKPFQGAAPEKHRGKTRGGGMLVDLLRTHPRIIVSGTLMLNPYFLPPDRYVGSTSQN